MQRIKFFTVDALRRSVFAMFQQIFDWLSELLTASRGGSFLDQRGCAEGCVLFPLTQALLPVVPTVVVICLLSWLRTCYIPNGHGKERIITKPLSYLLGAYCLGFRRFRLREDCSTTICKFFAGLLLPSLFVTQILLWRADNVNKRKRDSSRRLKRRGNSRARRLNFLWILRLYRRGIVQRVISWKSIL